MRSTLSKGKSEISPPTQNSSNKEEELQNPAAEHLLETICKFPKIISAMYHSCILQVAICCGTLESIESGNFQILREKNFLTPN